MNLRTTPDEAAAWEELENEILAALLFGPTPPPAPPKPRKEYWMMRDGDGQKMVVVTDDGVHDMDYAAKEWYTPLPTPFALEKNVHLIRRCTGFDF